MIQNVPCRKSSQTVPHLAYPADALSNQMSPAIMAIGICLLTADYKTPETSYFWWRSTECSTLTVTASMPGCDIPETLEGFQVFSLHSAHVFDDIMPCETIIIRGLTYGGGDCGSADRYGS